MKNIAKKIAAGVLAVVMAASAMATAAFADEETGNSGPIPVTLSAEGVSGRIDSVMLNVHYTEYIPLDSEKGREIINSENETGYRIDGDNLVINRQITAKTNKSHTKPEVVIPDTADMNSVVIKVGYKGFTIFGYKDYNICDYYLNDFGSNVENVEIAANSVSDFTFENFGSYFMEAHVNVNGQNVANGRR